MKKIRSLYRRMKHPHSISMINRSLYIYKCSDIDKELIPLCYWFDRVYGIDMLHTMRLLRVSEAKFFGYSVLGAYGEKQPRIDAMYKMIDYLNGEKV